MGRRPTKDAKENELKSSALSSVRKSCGSTGRLGHIRASCAPDGVTGCSLELKRKSGELIVVDEESQKVKYVRTARRIPRRREVAC